jgi:cation transport ATPase
MTITLTFEVTGMHCGACVNRVTNAFAQWAERAQVTLIPPRLTLENPRTTDLSKLTAIASAAGNYAIAPLGDAPVAAASAVPRAVSIPVTSIQRAVPAVAPATALEAPTQSLARYRPLAIIFAFIVLASLITPLREGQFHVHAWMHDFMGVFFLVFAFFKLLDIRGFANAFAAYDPIAKRWPGYGLMYPFIELALGVAFLLYWQMVAASLLTIVVLGITTVGVVQVLRDKQTIQCACVGTGFNLPMSTVTIIENTLMIAMSLWMIGHAL